MGMTHGFANETGAEIDEWVRAAGNHRVDRYNLAEVFFREPVRILVCRGHETITEITSYDRSNRDQEEQEPEGAEAVP